MGRGMDAAAEVPQAVEVTEDEGPASGEMMEPETRRRPAQVQIRPALVCLSCRLFVVKSESGLYAPHAFEDLRCRGDPTLPRPLTSMCQLQRCAASNRPSSASLCEHLSLIKSS